MAKEKKRFEMTEEVLKKELFLAGKQAGYEGREPSSEHEIYQNGWNEGEAERLKEQK